MSPSAVVDGTDSLVVNKVEGGLASGRLDSFDVLVVDDDGVVLDELVACLSQAGLSCIGARDAWEALNSLAEGACPAVVVTDIRMPELDGIEFAQRLARLTPKPEIVFVSGNAELDDAVEALRLGARDLLTKPIDLRRLIQIVKEVLIARRAADSHSGDAGALPTLHKANMPTLKEANSLEAADVVLNELKALHHLRGKHLPTGMAVEASWEMLLDLYTSEKRGDLVSLTSLGISSGSPLTSALRRIHELEKEKFIERLPDDTDRRRSTLRLSESGRLAVEGFLKSYWTSRRVGPPQTLAHALRDKAK